MIAHGEVGTVRAGLPPTVANSSPFFNMVFGDCSMIFPWQRRQPFSRQAPVAMTLPPASKRLEATLTAVQKEAKRRKLCSEAVSSLDEDRRKQLSQWLSFVQMNPAASQVGQQLTEAIEKEDPEAEAMCILKDVFGKKATNTLKQRASGMQSFIDWASDETEEQLWPISEPLLYRYLRHLDESRAAPTKATTVLNAVSFAYYVVGLKDSEDAVTSLR